MLIVLGASMALQPRGSRSWNSDWEEGASRQAVLLSSWKEDAGRREMHLVLRIVCAKLILEQSGAVCLLSGRVFLSEPRWLVDLNSLFVERLKCVKEIRWECVVLFLSITRMLSV